MKICDCHNDFLTEFKNFEDKKAYIKNSIIKNKYIKKIACVIWTSKLNNVTDFIDKNFKLLQPYNKKILLSLEDINFVAEDGEIDFEFLNYLSKYKIFSCGLVWNNDNMLGGGAYGKKGLTNLGKKFVQNLESRKILIDTAHMNRKTFYKFIKITRYPIYNSHSNIYSFKRHKRNLSDNQIKTIINSNGFIGLSFVCEFISDKIVDCNKVALQIKFFIDKFGCDNIGIGSDFYGTTNLPTNLKDYSDLKNLKKSLRNQGVSLKIINKIFYKNFINFQKRLAKFFKHNTK